MDDPAVSLRRAEAPHPTFARVLAGEIDGDADYSAYRERGTRDWLLLHTVAGTGRVVGSAGPVLTGPGQSVVYAPGERHDYGTAAQRWHLLFAHFHPRPEWIPLLQWPIDGIRTIHTTPQVGDEVVAHLRRIGSVATAQASHAALRRTHALEAALLALDSCHVRRGPQDARLRRVLQHIADHLEGELDVGTLADLVHLSPSRLSHLFRDEVGMGPRQYVERERLERAALLLRFSDYPVGEVARRSGWTDPLYFSRRFALVFGRPPSAYRAGEDEVWASPS